MYRIGYMIADMLEKMAGRIDYGSQVMRLWLNERRSKQFLS